MRARHPRLPEHAIMDLNRRHLIGASAAGVAGALAMPPDAARAAPLTSALGRDATQYGVRPGSPDDQTRVLQRAIDEAARAQVPLALPPGVYRTGLLRLHERHAAGRRARRDQTRLQRRRLDVVRRRRRPHRPHRHHAGWRRHCAAGPARPGALPRRVATSASVDCEIAGSGGAGIWFEQVSGDVSGNIITNTASTAFVSFDAQGLLVSRNTIQRHQRQRHRNPAHRDRR